MLHICHWPSCKMLHPQLLWVLLEMPTNLHNTDSAKLELLHLLGDLLTNEEPIPNLLVMEHLRNLIPSSQLALLFRLSVGQGQSESKYMWWRFFSFNWKTDFEGHSDSSKVSLLIFTLGKLPITDNTSF